MSILNNKSVLAILDNPNTNACIGRKELFDTLNLSAFNILIDIEEDRIYEVEICRDQEGNPIYGYSDITDKII